MTNLLLAGVGGQGVLLASEIVAEAAFRSGFAVKKSEVHGMAQRGGGVTSHLRFGPKVYSPLIPIGQADFLLALNPEEGRKHRFMLRPQGRFLDPEGLGADTSRLGRALNTYMIGALSPLVPIELDCWLDALRHCVKPQFVEMNLGIFHQGRQSQSLRRNTG